MTISTKEQKFYIKDILQQEGFLYMTIPNEETTEIIYDLYKNNIFLPDHKPHNKCTLLYYALYYFIGGNDKEFFKSIKFVVKRIDIDLLNTTNSYGEIVEPTEQKDSKVSYKSGDSITRNLDTIFKYYENNNNMIYLGICYYKGYGCVKNYTEAVKIFQKLADLGDTYAMNKLGKCFYKGYGVELNYIEALKWWKLGSDNVNLKARSNLLNLCKTKYLEISKMTLAMNKENKKYRERIEQLKSSFGSEFKQTKENFNLLAIKN
jgi:TPR repeat protein